jgi:hypothetical protein
MAFRNAQFQGYFDEIQGFDFNFSEEFAVCHKQFSTKRFILA